MLPDTMTISNKLGKCILWKTADQKEVLLPLFFNNFPLTFCFCISSFSWWMSLRGNVLLSQNERLGGLWTYVIRIIKPFSFLSSLLFYVLCFPMWPFLWEKHQAFISFSPFSFHSMQEFSFHSLLRVLQCLPGGEGAWGEFEETLSCPSENPWKGFLLVMGIPGDYSAVM